VHYERLILEAGDNAVTLRFHPRMTVIAGVGAQERDLLIAELIGALGGGRHGVHLELHSDAGRRVCIARPAGTTPGRVVELDSGADVTEEFASAIADGASGRLDLLALLGLSAEEARARCRLTAAELAVRSRADAVVAALAASDQPRLWAAAGRVVAAEQALADAARRADAAVEDAPVAEEIERRHAAFEAAQRRTRGARHDAIFIAGSCTPAAAAAVALHNRLAAVGFVAVGAVTTVVSAAFRRRAQAARRAELAALAATGAESYFGFELQRIDSLLTSRQGLALVAAASEEQRRALAAWRAAAGEIDARWAIAHREAITERARDGAGAVNSSMDIDPLKLAEWLVDRFAAARREGTTGESLPLVLDDPLIVLDAGTKHWALGLISRFAGSPQVIYLTADRDVVAWGRAQALGGGLSVVDPAPDPTGVGSEQAASTV
jgi:hypothetical protein